MMTRSREIATSTDQVEIIHKRRVITVVRRLSWLAVKLNLAAWALAIMIVPPVEVISWQGSVIHYTWTSLCFIGCIVSAVGIGISLSGNPTKILRVAVPIELSGLALILIGPVIYWITQLGLMFSDLPSSFQDRFALTLYAQTMVFVVIARLCTVIPRFHRE